ncbi:MAG: VCBS repeat-containing protein [Planctomycetota bacterium]
MFLSTLSGCRSIVVATGLAGSVSAQLFVDLPHKLHVEPSTVGYPIGAADFDRDGSVDLLFEALELLFNRGDARFAPRIGSVVKPAFCGDPGGIGDFDGDGWVDLLLWDGADLYLQRNVQGRLVPGPLLGTAPGRWWAPVEVGDFDGDGDLDGVRATGRREVQLVRNDGSTFSFHTLLGAGAQDVAVGDVDGDGDLDVLAARGGAPLRILYNDGRGGFAERPGAVSVVIGYSAALLAFDADGDGALDLMSVTGTSDLQLTLNDGRGGLLPSRTQMLPGVGGSVRQIKAADIDADGDSDVLVDRGVFRNEGAGSFVDVTATWVDARTTCLTGIATDLDADGDDDVVAVDGKGLSRAGTTLLLSNGTDHLEVAVGPAWPPGFPVDLTGDGDLDRIGNGVWINRGNRFTDETSPWLPGPKTTLNVWGAFDADGDGDNDVLADTSFSTSLGLYENTGTSLRPRPFPTQFGVFGPPSVGDLDGDGDVDLLVLSHLPAFLLNDGAGNFTDTPQLRPSNTQWLCAAPLADFDGDGDVDIAAQTHRYRGPSENRLFDNRQGAFVDVTAARGLPQAFGCVAAGDVDGDGDPDMVWAQAGRDLVLINQGAGFFASMPWAAANDGSEPTRLFLEDFDGDQDLDLLRYPSLEFFANDGTGRFHDASSVAFSLPTPIGQDPLPGTLRTGLHDFDGDGDIDLSPGWLNRLRQLHAPHLARVGHDYAVDLYARPGFAASSFTALTWVSHRLAARPIEIPTFGRFALEPWNSLRLSVTSIPAPAGQARLTFRIPNRPALMGTTLHTQSLLVSDRQPQVVHELTGVISDRIGG